MHNWPYVLTLLFNYFLANILYEQSGPRSGLTYGFTLSEMWWYSYVFFLKKIFSKNISRQPRSMKSCPASKGNPYHANIFLFRKCCLLIKLRSEIVWHWFFAVPAFICHFMSYIPVRKLLVYTSTNFSSRFCACASFWQSPDILGKIKKLRNMPAD